MNKKIALSKGVMVSRLESEGIPPEYAKDAVDILHEIFEQSLMSGQSISFYGLFSINPIVKDAKTMKVAGSQRQVARRLKLKVMLSKKLADLWASSNTEEGRSFKALRSWILNGF